MAKYIKAKLGLKVRVSHQVLVAGGGMVEKVVVCAHVYEIQTKSNVVQVPDDCLLLYSFRLLGRFYISKLV